MSKQIGIIEWYGGLNKKINKENKFGYLSNGIRIEEINVICSTNLLYENIVITYEFDEKKRKALNVNLLTKETDVEFLIKELSIKSNQIQIKEYIKARLLNILNENKEVSNDQHLEIILQNIGVTSLTKPEEVLAFLNNKVNLVYLKYSFIVTKINNSLEQYLSKDFLIKIFLDSKIGKDFLKVTKKRDEYLSIILTGSNEAILQIVIKNAELFSKEESAIFINTYQSELAEYVFENKGKNNYPIVKLMQLLWLEEAIKLENLTKANYLDYVPQKDFYSKILFIKKGLMLFKSGRDLILLRHLLDSLPNEDNNNYLLICLIELIKLFYEDRINHNFILESVGRNFWKFLDSKQYFLKKDDDVIYDYFALILPKCCSHSRFREARFRDTKENVEINLKQWRAKSETFKDKTFIKTGPIDNCTGEFNCRTDKCYHAETYASIDPSKSFKDYTLIDIFNILNFETFLEPIRKNDKTYYIAILSGWINHIVEPKRYYHFLCSYCENLMLPSSRENKDNYYFDWTRIATTFRCKNHLEQKHDASVYISHCRNPFCSEIIDSRTSPKRCSNQKYICPTCNFCNCDTHINWERVTIENSPCLKCFRPMSFDKPEEYHCNYCNKKYQTEEYADLCRMRGIFRNKFMDFNKRISVEEILNNKYIESFKPMERKIVDNDTF